MLTLNVISSQLPQPIQGISLNKQRRKRTTYNLNIFVEEARKIHGIDYNYDEITESHINQGVNSKVPITCRQCGNRWETSIKVHINSKSKCPNCSKHWTWNVPLFIARATEIHGDKFDYSLILSSHINGKDSHVPIICKNCKNIWTPTIASHINNKSGCPNCPRVDEWNLSKFLNLAGQEHGEKYDYSLVKEEHITGAYSSIPVICKQCGYNWCPTINNHINHGHGCPDCGGIIRYTLERFLQRARSVHGDRYNYTLITSDMIHDAYSKLPIICNICKHLWHPTINSHINSRTGCPFCCASKGELACASILNSLGISYISEAQILSLPTNYFDFMFYYNEHKFIIEYDGIQHFEYNNFFHRTMEKFIHKQNIDIIKTQKAINEGYKVIRISYLDIDDVQKHIITALRLNKQLYVSDTNIYQYLTSKLILAQDHDDHKFKYLTLDILRKLES
jgi:predicted Zn-ribbon and HTH transcriptional regulator